MQLLAFLYQPQKSRRNRSSDAASGNCYGVTTPSLLGRRGWFSRALGNVDSCRLVEAALWVVGENFMHSPGTLVARAHERQPFAGV
jgi:hypothetical protein